MQSQELKQMDSKIPCGDFGNLEYLHAIVCIATCMDKETIRAYYAFVRWHNETLLPVLTYCFGKWVGLLYSLLVPFWFIGAFAGSTAVKGKGKKTFYGSCMSFVGIQLLLTLLDYYGIACWDMPVVFSTADWTAMIPIATIQLTVMLFMVCENDYRYAYSGPECV